MSRKFHYKSIGIIQTSFTHTNGMPIQSSFSDEKGKVILSKKYLKAIKGLDGFSHIILLYHFHKAKKTQLTVKPFLSEQELGLFAVRAPNRPNSIGLSVVKLLEINEMKNSIEIIFLGADILNQTPLLDIKPYIREFDSYPEAKCGWYDNRKIDSTLSDNRFSKQ